MNIFDFQKKFPDDDACKKYLYKITELDTCYPEKKA